MNIPVGSSGAQRAGWEATVGTAIALQWGVILALAVVAWVLADEKAAGSVFLGGVSVGLPNAVLALWLTLRLRQAGTLSVIAMLVGELLKLGLTLALLVGIIAKFKTDLLWLALIVGVVGALKAQWLALWVTRRY